jgi:hypothetical protein
VRITQASTLRDIAFIVCTELHRQGTTAVLTGGGAATIYSDAAYISRDLDFVISLSGRADEQALLTLGFSKKGTTYVHSDTRFTLDFPEGPLSIGDDHNLTWDTMHDGDMVLHIIKPTDSVLDRLAAYVHWRDKGSLESAAIVAIGISDRLDWSRIESWCRSEGASGAVQELRSEMSRLERS